MFFGGGTENACKLFLQAAIRGKFFKPFPVHSKAVGSKSKTQAKNFKAIQKFKNVASHKGFSARKNYVSSALGFEFRKNIFDLFGCHFRAFFVDSAVEITMSAMLVAGVGNFDIKAVQFIIFHFSPFIKRLRKNGAVKIIQQ